MLQAAAGIGRQLAVKAREFLEKGRTEIRVTLDPPSLGKLRVNLEVGENRIVARILAWTAETAGLLAREREELVRAFQEQGIDDVEVEIDSRRERPSEESERSEPTPGDDGDPSIRPEPRTEDARSARTGASRTVDLFV